MLPFVSASDRFAHSVSFANPSQTAQQGADCIGRTVISVRPMHPLESNVNGMKHAAKPSDESCPSGAIMEAQEHDLEESYFQQTGKTVDKSIGYVMVALGVFLFFSMFLFGMSRVQNASDQIVSETPPIVNDSEPEISDRVESARN